MAELCLGHVESELEDEPRADKNDTFIQDLHEVAQAVKHWHDAQVVGQKQGRKPVWNHDLNHDWVHVDDQEGEEQSSG